MVELLFLILTNFQAHWLFTEQTNSAAPNFNNFWPQITLASGLNYVTRLQAGILQRVAVNRSNFLEELMLSYDVVEKTTRLGKKTDTSQDKDVDDR